MEAMKTGAKQREREKERERKRERKREDRGIYGPGFSCVFRKRRVSVFCLTPYGGASN